MKEESKSMVKEVDFMKRKGAPKSMIKHEESEMESMKHARGGGVGEARMLPAGMERGHDLARGNKPFGEHPVQKSGRTRVV
jgi:hypothetical protein